MERTAKDMFEKAFDTIDQPDLEALVAGQVAEHRMLEFKREYSSKDDADGELLRDLTAMANAQGGDFLIGIDQTKSGVARAILGVEIENLDKKQQAYESLIRDRTEPRLSNYRLRFIPLSDGRYVTHFRLRASLAAPHAVRTKSHRNYYVRSSAGKHEMDVGELRDAFTASEQLFPRLRRLHAEAIERAKGSDMPLCLDDAPRCIMSLIPRSYFREQRDLPITRDNALIPFDARGYDIIPCLEGLLAHGKLWNHAGNRKTSVSNSYVLNHWDGRYDIAWTVGSQRLTESIPWSADPSPQRERIATVSPRQFEQGMLGMTVTGIAKLRELGVEGPWTVFVTIEGIQSARLALGGYERSLPAWRDSANLSGLTIDQASAETLMPFATAFWLLFGQHRPADRPIGEP